MRKSGGQVDGRVGRARTAGAVGRVGCSHGGWKSGHGSHGGRCGVGCAIVGAAHQLANGTNAHKAGHLSAQHCPALCFGERKERTVEESGRGGMRLLMGEAGKREDASDSKHRLPGPIRDYATDD
eukprot:1897192-Pyramimonas_sp.AAC.1